ncbi:ATP-dependent zinc metalloprotease FtsH [Thermoleptolyngbya oregonensis NK1-22]|uniref:ATP-dependent zinc metalloprotease FtsH n=1 Tax=Thermoleptolyngbya oregonensis NK1-22 TaxID=2547457 RepID=A0AA96Y6J6_9CYAN|nr:ATP-dependent zinc metalloprotease FtsH [Thermoleptolyngbya oregonensis]WOB45211.1 ATP-dependent zinc metalloprotease FtsH [Thermoleptolyngbya oregonensis NK1-22]
MKPDSRSLSTYSTFLDQVKSSQVQRVVIKRDRIDYSLKPELGGEQFYTLPNGPTDTLPGLLRRHGVPFTKLDDNGDTSGLVAGILLSTGMLVGMFAWLARLNQAGGGSNNSAPGSSFGSGLGNNFGGGFGGLGVGMGMGRSNARVYNQAGKGKVTFADVAGVDESKQELQEIVDFLANGEKYRRIGAKIPKGVLLVGPPGTGKTLLAKAIAGEAGVPFISMSGSEFVEVFVGVGASRVRDLFNRAKRQAPCIVFIDELDAIGKTRSANPVGGNDERDQTLNQLLTEMDGFDGNDGVIVIAATNRPEILDPALRRPGRFDRQVLVDRPDKSGRLQILKVHARPVKLGEDVDLEAIAAQTAGFSGADLANLVNEAALMAARNNRQAVLMADVNEAIERVIAGLEKRSRVLTPLERQTVAYHEVGHALVGALMPGNTKVSKISIVPRGLGALGYTVQTPESDRFLLLEDELRGQLATLLGGRSAEEIVFGKVSTGASDDIQRATDLAERAITQYGMSETLGPIAFDKNQAQFLDGGSTRRAISPEVAAEIDRQVKQALDKAHDMALDILRLNRDLLESATQTLLKEEVLEGSTLAAILAQVKAPEGLQPWLTQG